MLFRSRPRAKKIIISEEEDEPPQEKLGQRLRTRQATAAKANSTLVEGALGQTDKAIGRNNVGSSQQNTLPTPDPSQASSPQVPDGSWALRPRAVASSQPAKLVIPTQGRGKVQGGKMPKGKRH